MKLKDKPIYLVKLWKLLGDYESLQALYWYYRGSVSAWGVWKLVKIKRSYIYSLWALSVHFHITKVGNKYIFSGSANLWKRLGEYGPKHALLWYYMGVWECVEVLVSNKQELIKTQIFTKNAVFETFLRFYTRF